MNFLFTDQNGITLETDFYDVCSYSKRLEKIENCTEKVFSFEDTELNKFYGQYFGVVNLSNYSIRFEELKILGRGLKFCPTPPLYDHSMAKESIDKFFRNANLFLFFLMRITHMRR